MERQKRLFKIGTCTFIWLLALVFALIRGGFHWWFVLGMSACWLGDMTLSQYKPVAGWTRSPFVGGTAMFFIGHLCYAVGLISGASRTGMSGWSFIVCFLILALLEGALFMTVLWPRRAIAAPLKVAAGAYIALVCVNTALGFALAAKNAVLWPLAVGGLLFTVSDTVIGLRDLGGMRIPGGDIVIWGPYAPAQLLFIIGSLILG